MDIINVVIYIEKYTSELFRVAINTEIKFISQFMRSHDPLFNLKDSKSDLHDLK